MLALGPGVLERFIGVFYRVNSKRPPPRPDYSPDKPLRRLVITKGMLQLMMDDEKVDVVIPTEEQVDEETYKSFVNLLTQELVNLLQVPHYTPEIRDALNNSGLVAEFQGVTLMMNPLKASTGEQDQF